MITVAMSEYEITSRAPVLIGYEGENLSRTFEVQTSDDLTDVSSINLMVGETDCGAMTITSGDPTSITIELSKDMIGKAGYKKAQLVMYDSTGAVIMKTGQFDVLVGASNKAKYYAAGEVVDTILVNIDGQTRQIVLPANFAVSVNGDVAVDKIAFRAPVSYGDFDFADAACRVEWIGIDGVSHKNLCTETDADGNWIWQMPTALTKGGSGEISFSVSYVITDENDAVTADWNTGLTKFYHLASAKSDETAEDEEEETTYDRLASAIAAVRSAQASVDDINTIISSMTSSSPTVVATAADLNNLDTTAVKLAIVAANGYVYYYDGSSWQQGFEFGVLQEIINARTGVDGTVYANLKARIDAEISALKADLTSVSATVGTLDGVTYTAANALSVGGTQNGYQINSSGALAGGSGYCVKYYRVVPGEVIYLKLSADGPVTYVFLATKVNPSASADIEICAEAVDGFVTVPATANYIAIAQLQSNETNEIKSTTSERTGLIEEVNDMLDKQEIVYASADLSGASSVSGSAYANKINMSGIPITDAGYIKVVWRDKTSSFTADAPTLTFVVCKFNGSSYEIVGTFTASSIPFRTNVYQSSYYVDGNGPYYVGYYGINPSNISLFTYGWFVSSETFSSAENITVGTTFTKGSNWSNASIAMYPSVVSTNKKIHDEIAEIKDIIASNTAAENGKYVHFSIDDCAFWTNLIDNAGTYESAFEEGHLALYKSIHDLYGAVFTLNVFCTSGDYSIENIPSTWAAEFAANTDWLKFAYHAEDASTYLSNLTAEAAAASYAKFVNGIYTMTGTTDAIDRIARLGFFDGSEENCLALRDCACGIVGLLCADDTRNSYYLTSDQSEFVRTHAYYRDYENQLIFLNTIRRFEYYTVTDAAELLTPAKGNINRYIEFFTHEAASSTDRFTPFAAWAVENGYKFGFMQDILRV